ncbi:hypothetical protein PENTCL1PPCAC_2899, partial [Pristionchus entomophagus]
RFARHAYSGVKNILDGGRIDNHDKRRLLQSLYTAIRPHLRWNEAVDDLLTYQCLLESHFELTSLVQVIGEVNQTSGKDGEMKKLLNLASAFVTKVERLQEKAIIHYRREVWSAMEEGRMRMKREEEQLPMPIPVRRVPTSSRVPINDSIQTSMREEEGDGPIPLIPLLFEDKIVKEEPLAPPPFSSRMVLRKRKVPSYADDDDEEKPSTSNGSRREHIKREKSEEEYREVKKESSRESPTSFFLKNGTDEGPSEDPSLLGVFSKNQSMELEVPWDGLGQVHEESNIGQPSSKSCPFCPQMLIGRRTAITRHVREAHKDLWPEFAQLTCPALECDYRATSTVTMKAHTTVSHGAEWERWERQRWFDLPRDSYCPYCIEERTLLNNLAEYRQHVEKEHLWDVAMKPRSIGCCDCNLKYKYTNELFIHWSKRGSSCSSGAYLIDTCNESKPTVSPPTVHQRYSCSTLRPPI